MKGKSRKFLLVKEQMPVLYHGTNVNLDSGQEGTLSGLREIRAVGLIKPQ
jgi:hypothetical protein